MLRINGFSLDSENTKKVDDLLSVRRTRHGGWNVFCTVPRQESGRRYSFDEGVERPGLTVEIRLDRTLKLVERTMHLSLATNRSKLTESTFVATCSDSAHPMYRSLRDFETLAKLLWARRRLNSDQRSPQALVQAVLLLVNLCAADYAHTNKLRVVYLKAHPNQIPRGVLSRNNLPYLQITSPLWREVDEANGDIIAAFLEGKPYPFSEQTMRRLAKEAGGKREYSNESLSRLEEHNLAHVCEKDSFSNNLYEVFVAELPNYEEAALIFFAGKGPLTTNNQRRRLQNDLVMLFASKNYSVNAVLDAARRLHLIEFDTRVQKENRLHIVEMRVRHKTRTVLAVGRNNLEDEGRESAAISVLSQFVRGK